MDCGKNSHGGWLVFSFDLLLEQLGKAIFQLYLDTTEAMNINEYKLVSIIIIIYYLFI